MDNNYSFPLLTECMLFFQENPYAFETAEGLALRLGRKIEHLLPVLEHFVTTSILELISNGENPIYRYKQPDALEVNMSWEQA
jgi:hypothetical protein